MPLFLGAQDLYRILQRELPPDDVYPDSGSPSAFFATSDNFAIAKVLSDYYTGPQQQTYNNEFAITATGANGRLSDHEIMWLGAPLDQTQYTVAERLALVLAQIRFQPAPTLWNILTLALTFVPPGVRVGIVPYYSAMPFVYNVRIYEYTMTPQALIALTIALTAAGPARSPFVISQNVNLATYNLNWYLPNASQASLVQNAYVDPSGSPITGYTGVVDFNTNESFEITDQQGNILTDQMGNAIVTQSGPETIITQGGDNIDTQGGDDIVTNQ
jgi:hypothetical protein